MGNSWLRFACVIFLCSAFVHADDKRELNLRGQSWSANRQFNDQVVFVSDHTVLVSFNATSSGSEPVVAFDPKDPNPTKDVLRLIAVDFDSGTVVQSRDYRRVGIVHLLALRNQSFLLADVNRVTLFSARFQELASYTIVPSGYQPRVSPYTDISLSPEEDLIFLTSSPRLASHKSTANVTVLNSSTLNEIDEFSIPDLPLESRSRYVLDSNGYFIARQSSGQSQPRLMIKKDHLPETPFATCTSGVPLLITAPGRVLLNCPPFSLSDFEGHIKAQNDELPRGKEAIGDWTSYPKLVKSSDGHRVAFCAAQLGGGSEFWDIGPHVTKERVVVLDGETLKVSKTIPMISHKSGTCRVALSLDGRKLAYLHDGILSLASLD